MVQTSKDGHWLYPITWGLSSIVYIFDLRKYKLLTPRV